MKFRTSMTRRFTDAEPPKKFEEVRDQPTAEEASKARAEGIYVQEESASEKFAKSSDRMHGYRGTLTSDDLAGLSPVEQFSARSAQKWASHDPRGRIADLRRRRSE
jgi:hypothetical protein